MNININKSNRFDAIVIGAGMSGGWAAKEFTEKGLNTLVLERGRHVEHVTDYPTAHLEPWDDRYRFKLSPDLIENNPIVSKCYAFTATQKDFFVKDKEHPYVQIKPFDWIRAYQVGVNHYCGQDKSKDGVTWILWRITMMDMVLIGLSDTRI